MKENADFLKKEYGIGGVSEIKAGTGIGLDTSAAGIKLQRGYMPEAPVYLINWNDAAKRINELIKCDHYLSMPEAEEYSKWLLKNEETIQQPSIKNEEVSYEYHLKDKVFIGADEYEIVDIRDDKICLYDANCPLINKELPIEIFEKRIKENPYNDHLIKKDVAENIYDNDKPNEEKIKDDYQDGLTDITPKWEEKIISIPEPFNFVGEKKNYQLPENYDSYRTKRERFEDNIRAIELLKELTEEGRYASEEEQAVLSKYVGWGGLSESFDEDNASWQKEYQKLKSILDEDEYVSARESTLTSFYTPKVVIDAIYKVISQMGFVDGNILDPCCGIGNFMGVLPKEMENSRIYGVEIDKISGQIAKQLYQNNSITIKGYEDVSLSDSFFDIAVGNVPFGDFKVGDKRYDKNNWLIHDYFFGKTLDKVRPSGVIAFITSKGTMDKANSKVRKYIAQRAELLGAIRLPNDTFSKNAGTEVTADIIFLQKRDRCVEEEQSWIHLGTNEDGITMNQYFIEHPEMVLGEMKTISGRFGPETVCTAFEDSNLNELLESAISNIHGEIEEYERDEVDEEDRSIPADPEIRNFSYTINDGEIYFRENSRMYPVEVSETAKSRIKGLISIRESVRTLIEIQTENYEESEIKKEQDKLNLLYDNFTKKYGLITSRANSSAFSEDSSYYLLTALEVVDENGNLVRKADMFHKRTIKPNIPITHCDTASEALAISLGEKACIDILYMQKLTGKSENDLYNELQGIIFLNPKYERGLSNTKYLTNDEYLSGNVREKLNEAKELSQSDERYNINIKYLEKVQPKDLTAGEISVRLGATWIPKEIIEDFIFELLDTPRYMRWNIKVHYSEYTGEWNIEGKNNDRGNVSAYSTYGTARANAYKIIEDTLNLKDVRIFDYEVDEDGKKKAILNKKETAIAQGKQEIIKNVFIDWIWKEAKRRELLTKMYNERFNSIRPREYDGSHIIFSGMNPEIKLREHQVNAIARILYGGNTLLAHAVGAGKTYEMVAAAMESKRLGLCNKSLFVVPNHLTEQWASEFLQLYPSANILVATRKDFQKNNRKKFCARIATGDYDAIIIGHTQLEKIPMSDERQRNMIEAELEEITQGIAELKKSRGERYSIKALEKSKKQIKLKLDKLNDQSQKDDVVTFEELGVDRLFIDESHYYKNLFLHTKMRNVGGIAQTEAQKSSDLFMKCRYLDEIAGGKGIIFATGTPISNSMVELYTIQRYLQYDRLKSFNLQHFDCWASTFGETVTAIELAPEGTGYRAKTRFAKFYNLPELMAMFKEVADIQTADMLNLPVPKAEFHNVSVKPSEFQKSMVSELSERADRVRNKMVDSSVDNMLLITNDGRKLALDQRLINSNLPDFEGSKINACVDNIYNIWKDNYNDKLTQLVFCDLSTPKSDGSFNVYDDIKEKLIKKGVAEDEIEYIHNASTEMKKKILFGKVRSGDVRALLGSTQKMGAGTNVQDKLIALHDIDCPWRPSDFEQRLGRIVRQGNENEKVDVYRYVTEETFDAYLYQIVENKQKFISQIMTGKSPVRSAEDIDEAALSYAEIKMLATGNPHIKEKMDLDIQVSKLKLLKQNFLSEKYALEDKLIKYYPSEIKRYEERIRYLKEDIEYLKLQDKSDKEHFAGMILKSEKFIEKSEAGKKILCLCKEMRNPDPIEIGEYRGFKMTLSFDTFSREYQITLSNKMRYTVSLGDDIYGNITRLDNALEGIEKRLKDNHQKYENILTQKEKAELEVNAVFPHEDELNQKTKRLDELNVLLNLDQNDREIFDEKEETIEEDKERAVER